MILCRLFGHRYERVIADSRKTVLFLNRCKRCGLTETERAYDKEHDFSLAVLHADAWHADTDGVQFLPFADPTIFEQERTGDD